MRKQLKTKLKYVNNITIITISVVPKEWENGKYSYFWFYNTK